MKRFSLLLLLTATLTGCGGSGNEAPVVEAKPQSAPSSQTPQPSKSYEELLSSATELTKQGQLNRAVQVLSQAASQNPKRTEAFLKRAAICADNKLLSQAILDMSSALALEPNNAKFLNTRGYFYLLSKQYDRADRDFSDAIGLDLNYPQPYNNRGLISVAQGEFEAAIKDFDNALAAKPDYLDAHNNRGFALLRSEQYEESVAAFTKALEIDPNYLNALTNRARAEMKLNDATAAIEDLTKAIELQPEHAQHYLSRAEAYAASGKETAAAKDFGHVEWLRTLTDLNQRIARNTKDADAWALRGRHLLIENRKDEAKKSFGNALALKPSHTQALLGLAELALEEEDYATVIDDCTNVLKREHNYETYSLRGDAYFALEKYGEAIADYDSARRFDERVVQAYRNRAQQLRENGDEQLAKADEKMAKRLEKRLTEATATVESAAPRAMVIEQASYEEPAVETAAAPVKDKTAQ